MRWERLDQNPLEPVLRLCQFAHRVIGNNRTKSQLVGQLGLVKTATGLGGWHRVV